MTNKRDDPSHVLNAKTTKVEARMSDRVEAQVRRGEESWSYFYTLLGFGLTIETGVIAMIVPLRWPWNLITLALVGAITVYLFLDNGWFQNKLIGLKNHYEDKLR